MTRDTCELCRELKYPLGHSPPGVAGSKPCEKHQGPQPKGPHEVLCPDSCSFDACAVCRRPAQSSLPAMRGQVFEAVLGADGLLAAPLPFHPACESWSWWCADEAEGVPAAVLRHGRFGVHSRSVPPVLDAPDRALRGVRVGRHQTRPYPKPGKGGQAAPGRPSSGRSTTRTASTPRGTSSPRRGNSSSGPWRTNSSASIRHSR